MWKVRSSFQMHLIEWFLEVDCLQFWILLVSLCSKIVLENRQWIDCHSSPWKENKGPKYYGHVVFDNTTFIYLDLICYKTCSWSSHRDFVFFHFTNYLQLDKVWCLRKFQWNRSIESVVVKISNRVK